MATNINISDDDSVFNVIVDEKTYEIKVPMTGKHFIYNSLSSIAVGNELGIDINLIRKGIQEFELTKKRMDIQRIRNNIKIINDSYNASYDSTRAVLKHLRYTEGNKKIAVLGDMLELGEYSEELHRMVGKEITKHKIDVLITIGNDSKYIADEAKINKDNIYVCSNNQEAYEILENILEENDVVLLKASNLLNLSEILEMLKK